jgi:hypothetical protein
MDLSKLSEALRKDRQNINFGPEDSVILSSLLHPQDALKRGLNNFQSNVNTAMGVPDPKYQDEASPYTFSPTDKQKSESAFNLAGLAGTGSMPFNQAGGPATLGMFVGPKSVGWNHAKAQEAEQLLNTGVDPAQVWKEHLIGRMPSGHLFSEIDDSGMVAKDIQEAIRNRELIQRGPAIHGRISGAIEHPELDKNYPFINGPFDEQLKVQINLADPGGSYGNRVLEAPIEVSKINKSITAHELQHAIQDREGWPKGTNPITESVDEMYPQSIMEHIDKYNELRKALGGLRGAGLSGATKLSHRNYDNFDIFENEINKSSIAKEDKNKLHKILSDIDEARNKLYGSEQGEFAKDIGFQNYEKSFGEAQARATQDRLNMDMQQRAENYPFANGMFGGIPINELISKY